jgi:hypothetical protein
MNDEAVLNRQRELNQIIVDFKAGKLTKLRDLEPLKTFILKKLSKYNLADREDIYSRVLSSIWNGEIIPQEYETYLYIKQRIINALHQLGFIKDKKDTQRYLINRRPSEIKRDFHEYPVASIEKGYNRVEVAISATFSYTPRKINVLAGETSLF